LTKEILAALP